MKKISITLLALIHLFELKAQNPLLIPPTLTGTAFNLEIKNGTTQFYPGISTPTYGINGDILAPTLIVNKGDIVNINVTNNLTGSGNSTTIHWHGLHVPAKDDGGPHQIINQGSTWSPSFEIKNNAGTFWYHPHGDNKTDRHVSKGIAGMIIVRDIVEASLSLPRTYGVDDFPIIVQTKAFDVLNQIAISTELDTTLCVNSIVDAFLDAPAQVIRLRLLNGSSMRSYNFGFTNNKPFSLIATDAGLIDSAITLTRIRLSPGERAEILIDLQGMLGQNISLMSFSSEFTNGIYGAATVTNGMGGTIVDYDLNPLNGADFEVLNINVVNPTLNPINSLPTNLTTNAPFPAYTIARNFVLAPEVMNPTNMLIGPFNINGVMFNMDSIDLTTYLNTTEKWRITNNTGIAHPFHIHDMHFYITSVNGAAVPSYEQGKKDVVLVLPQQYVEFVTRFEDFADDSIPYMYHCHLLHHEDDGMMGSFLVVDTTSANIAEKENQTILVFPNPVSSHCTIKFGHNIEKCTLTIINSIGSIVSVYDIYNQERFIFDTSNLKSGLYTVKMESSEGIIIKKIIIE